METFCGQRSLKWWWFKLVCIQLTWSLAQKSFDFFIERFKTVSGNFHGINMCGNKPKACLK